MGYELYAMPFHAEARESFLLLIIPLILVAITVGLCWRPQVWLVCTVAFYGLCFVLYTTMFTNLDGIITGLGSTLGDLITQHSVRRGSQPQYYYLLTQLAVYEFLPCIGSMIAGLSGLWGLWHTDPIKKKSAERFPFILFVAVWAALIHVAFTFYGQKQPWLTMYLIVPMIFITGWYVGNLLEKTRQSPTHAILASGASPM
jgi:predicted membrane-bound mannosyltransferase